MQRRVSLLAKVMLGLGALSELQSILLLFFEGFDQHMVSRNALGHLVPLAAVTGMWLRCRSGVRGPLELRVYDVACVALPVLYWAVALWDAPVTQGPVVSLVFAYALLLILRSVLLPSTGRRTLGLGVATTALLAAWAVAYQLHMGIPGEDAAVGGIVVVISSFMGVGVATVASQTIFGLRQAVRRAMQLGQYTLIRKIGEGGMGVVWEAKHALLRRRTAIKLLPAERAGEDAIARFEREVQLTSTLSHPNTIAIYDYGRSADGVFYYAMEHLDGIDLQKLVDDGGPQPAGLVVHVLIQVCDALAEAHGVGLIHRDIKPANVILCERGGIPLVAKVLDFGLVKRVEAPAAELELSAANVIVGTPLYIAPEVVTTPERVDARSDLYSVGALGYFLLTGKSVFEGNTAVEVFAQHLHAPPIPPSTRLGAPVPADLEALVLRCLEKSPASRPESAAILSAELARCEARGTFTPDAAKAAWERCRDLASRSSAAPTPPTRLTVQVAARS